jgi:hypothetical protein
VCERGGGETGSRVIRKIVKGTMHRIELSRCLHTEEKTRIRTKMSMKVDVKTNEEGESEKTFDCDGLS